MRSRPTDTIAFDVSGRGRPLVLLHGAGADRSIWRDVMRRMRADRRLLALDLPGFGASPAISAGFDLAEAADAVARLLHGRLREPADLVGNSLGGAVAFVLALRRPELVDRLVLVAPAGFSPLPRLVAEPVARLAPAALVGRRLLGGPLMDISLARRVLLWGTIAAPQNLSARDARGMLQSSRRSSRLGAAVGAVLHADLLSELIGLQRPLGLLWGEQDRIIPTATLEAILAAYPAATAETLPDVGHVPQLERPEEFVDALHRLLARM